MNALDLYLTESNISDSEFSRLSGLKQPTVWRIRNGKSNASPRVAEIIEVASGGKVSRMELLYPDKTD